MELKIITQERKSPKASIKRRKTFIIFIWTAPNKADLQKHIMHMIKSNE